MNWALGTVRLVGGRGCQHRLCDQLHFFFKNGESSFQEPHGSVSCGTCRAQRTQVLGCQFVHRSLKRVFIDFFRVRGRERERDISL